MTEIPETMQKLRPLICAKANQYGIPRDLLAAVVQQESGGRVDATSYDGGHGAGLMQIDARFHVYDRARMLSDAAYALDYGCNLLAGLRDAWEVRGYGGWHGLDAATAAFNGDDSPTITYVEAVRSLKPLYAPWVPRVTSGDVLAEALRWVGATRREQFDATNGEGGVFGWCEAFVESCHERLGLTRVRYANALAFLNDPAIPTQPLPAPAGSCVLFGRATDPAGHVAISDGAGGMIGTTADSVAHTALWAGCAGWQWYPGVSSQQPVTISQPGTTISGNPYGAITLHPPFAERWQRLNDLSLAFPTLGYATESPVTLATGRVTQRFERAVLATGGDNAPWDVVSLLLSELPASNATPSTAPAARTAAPFASATVLPISQPR